MCGERDSKRGCRDGVESHGGRRVDFPNGKA